MLGEEVASILWDGRLARPDWAGKMPTPQLVKGFNDKVAHRVTIALNLDKQAASSKLLFVWCKNWSLIH